MENTRNLLRDEARLLSLLGGFRVAASQLGVSSLGPLRSEHGLPCGALVVLSLIVPGMLY